MARTKISEFSATPANNTDIDSINIAEGCAPSGINDAIRELMSQLKDFQTGAVGDSFNGPVGTTTAAAGAFTTLSATGVITSTLATGTAPLTIASTTKVANLNSDLLDGADWASPAALGSTTPAAVSATTLTTSSTVTHNGGTANGVTYLNGSKVLTSGSALTFDGTNLQFASGSGLFTNTSDGSDTATLAIGGGGANSSARGSVIEFYGNENASAGVLDITSGNVANSYVRIQGRSSTSYVRFDINASEQMRLTSTGLGIGTSSPAYKLDVSGVINSAQSVTDATVYIRNTATLAANRTAGVWLTNGGTSVGASTRDYIVQNIGTSASLSDLLFTYWNGSSYLERMRLNASGNLGLGVTPSAWGTDNSVRVFQNAAGSLWNFSTSYQILGQNYYRASSGQRLYSITAAATDYIQTAGQHQWYTAPSGTAGAAITFTQAMTLDASGNLGVGTTSAVGKLTVGSTGSIAILGSTGSSGTTGRGLTLYNSTSTDGNNFAAASFKAAFSGSTYSSGYGYFETVDSSGILQERARIDSSGNFGLGVTPSAWQGTQWSVFEGAYGGALAFYKASNVPVTVLTSNTYNDGGWKYKTTDPALQYEMDGNVGIHRWYNAPSGTAGAAISFTQAMTLDASGNLLVGKTATSFTTSGSELRADGLAAFVRNASSATLYVVKPTTTFTTGNMVEFRYNDTVTVGTISYTSTSVAYNTSSDYRLKNITGPITNSGAYIDSLNPVEGTWKADGSTFVGLIAHEAQEASRTQVATGTKDGEEMQGMSYSSSEMIANMIAELKALRARVAALEAA